MKKLLSSKISALLLVVALVCPLLVTSYGTTHVLAAESAVDTPEKLKNKVWSVVKQATPTELEGTHRIDGITINMDVDYLVVNKKSKETRWMENKPIAIMKKIKAQKAKTQKAGTQIKVGVVGIAHGFGLIPPERKNNSYPGKGYVLNIIAIKEITGFPPPYILVKQGLLTDDYKNGNYTTEKSDLQEFWGPLDMYEGKKEIQTRPVDETKFYKYDFDAIVGGWGWKKSEHESSENGPYLVNKKAFMYPCQFYDPAQIRVPELCVQESGGSSPGDPILYEDPYSGKVMFMPDTTLLSKTNNPVPPLTKEDRGEYIAEYIRRYGDPKKKNPKFNWANYDIHHIIPREYGGNHHFSNLIPLKREFHQKNVSPWWINY